MKRCFFILVIMMFTCLSIYAEESNEETSMIVYVEDKEGNVIKDTMFGIYNDEGKLLSMEKSDSQGKLYFYELEKGEFTIRLMENLSIYNMNKKEFTFHITDDNQNIVHIRLEKKRDVNIRDIVSQTIVWVVFLLGCAGSFYIYTKIK